MVNYESRNPSADDKADLIGGALSLLDEYSKENPKNPPKKASYDNDLFRDSHSNYEEMFGGALKSSNPHNEIVQHIITKMKPHHFYILRHQARNLRNMDGGILGNDPATWGATNDVANANNRYHLADMFMNDKKFGGDLSAGSFADTVKKIASSVNQNFGKKILV